jgi:hypothetical protein
MLIIEDGTARTDSQCVASVDDLNAYFALMGYDAIDIETAEVVLVRSWQYVETTYRGRWLGTRISPRQALSWPRSGVPDPDGFLYWYYWPNQIPPLLKDANCEAAKIVVDQVDLSISSVSNSWSAQPRLKARAAGGTSEEYEYPVGADGASAISLTVRNSRLLALDQLLAPFVTSSPGATFTNVEVVRA